MSAESRNIGGNRLAAISRSPKAFSFWYDITLLQESQLPNPKTATQEDIPPDRTKALPRGVLFFLCGMIFLLRRVDYATSLRKPLIAMQSFRLPSLRLHPLLLCLVLSLIYSLPAISQDSDKVEDGSDKKEGITVIVNLAGKVELIESEGAKPKSAEKGARVPVGATFLVGPDSRLDLALSNGALFQIRENSKFTIGEFEQEAYEFVFTNGAAIRPREIKDFGADEAVLQTMDASEEAWNKLGSEPTTSKGKFVLSEGTMIGQAKKLKPGSRMDIETPIGTAGIRGTVWMLTVKPVQSTGGTSYQGKLDVAEGRVDFGKSDGSRTVQVQGGYSATVDATVSATGEVRVANINTSPMPPERQAMLLSTVSTVAQQQTYFTAVNGNPDALREAIAQAQQAQGEGTSQPADPTQTDANPNQIGINDLPPVIPTNPIQPPPPAPAPTSTPTPPSPTPPSPTATPPPTPTPKPSNG
jgi:hypothetical protein